MLNLLSKKIKNNYGSKQGLVKFYFYQVLMYLGYFNRYKPAHLDDVQRIIFVCSGNICRSPFGEEVAKELGANALSYGLHCSGGHPAFERTITIASRLGFDLEQHISQNIKDYEPLPGDLVLATEPKHAKELESLNLGVPVGLLGKWGTKPFAYLHDPYNTNEIFFYKNLELIADATSNLIGGRQK